MGGFSFTSVGKAGSLSVPFIPVVHVNIISVKRDFFNNNTYGADKIAKVGKHNNLVERMYKLESRLEALEKQKGWE